MQRTEEEVRADLGSHEGRFHAVVEFAWADYADDHKKLRGRYTQPRVQAVLMHQYMENQARLLFGDVPGFYVPPIGSQLFYIDYQHKYLLKPRLIYPTFTVAMNWTNLALDFVDQVDGQLALGSMPSPMTHLHWGYLLNLTHTAMSGAVMVCPDGPYGYAWKWLLNRPDEGQQPIHLPQPDRGPLAWPKSPPHAADEQDVSSG